jgi:hypothetical protein
VIAHIIVMIYKNVNKYKINLIFNIFFLAFCRYCFWGCAECLTGGTCEACEKGRVWTATSCECEEGYFDNEVNGECDSCSDAVD